MCRPLKVSPVGQNFCLYGAYIWLDMLRAAEESEMLETALSSPEHQCMTVHTYKEFSHNHVKRYLKTLFFKE